MLSCKRQEASWANDPKFEKLSAFDGIRMHRLIKTIFRLVLWAVVVASAYYGLIGLRKGATLRKQYLDEMHDAPCEFRLDATKENHIQVPFHHSFDGLHGCVLCIRKSAVSGQMPVLKDASFMVDGVFHRGFLSGCGGSREAAGHRRRRQSGYASLVSGGIPDASCFSGQSVS